MVHKLLPLAKGVCKNLSKHSIALKSETNSLPMEVSLHVLCMMEKSYMDQECD